MKFNQKVEKRGKTLGIALGSGGAKGFAHIGVLKVLYKHKIFPDYLAGTSIGAVIAAAYAAGRSPEEIEQFMKHTDWKKIVDFRIPKVGLLEGKRIENKLQELVFDKDFTQLTIPLRIASYNLTRKKLVIFSNGRIAKALRASISIPGIFKPVEIKNCQYIDGAVADPIPFDIVKEMGAEVVLAVNLSVPEKKETGSVKARRETFFQSLKEKLVREELRFIGTALFPARWPSAIRKILKWLFDKIVYPARIMQMLTGKKVYPVATILYETINVLTNNLAKERLQQAQGCIIIEPHDEDLAWSDFDKIDRFIKLGEAAMEEKIPFLKKRIGK